MRSIRPTPPMSMRSILPTHSSASIHPTTAFPELGDGPGGTCGGSHGERAGGAAKGSNRWFHRVSDYFLGSSAAAAALPPSARWSVRRSGGGGDNAKTTPAYEEPSIRLSIFACQSDGDNEALAADGWRWRWAVYLTLMMVMSVTCSLVLFVSPPGWVGGVVLVFWVSAAATAAVLAIHQNSSCLQRKAAVATIIAAIVHLGCLGALYSSVFIGVDWEFVVSQNVSRMGEGNHSTYGAAEDLSAWFRVPLRRFCVEILLFGPLFNALLLPTSRGSRCVGIGFQLTVVPAARVSGHTWWGRVGMQRETFYVPERGGAQD